MNDRAPNDLLKALLFWGGYSQFPGCESVKWGLIEEVVMGDVAALKNRTRSIRKHGRRSRDGLRHSRRGANAGGAG